MFLEDFQSTNKAYQLLDSWWSARRQKRRQKHASYQEYISLLANQARHTTLLRERMKACSYWSLSWCLVSTCRWWFCCEYKASYDCKIFCAEESKAFAQVGVIQAAAADGGITAAKIAGGTIVARKWLLSGMLASQCLSTPNLGESKLLLASFHLVRLLPYQINISLLWK